MQKMQNRDLDIFNIRKDVLGEVSASSSIDEAFQNNTLRPILKLQNDLFIQIFINYAIKQKKVFFTLTIDKKLYFIDNALHRDFKFRKFLEGIVVGFFTLDEYKLYEQNASSLNRRMMNMLVERFKSQLQLLVLR